MMTTSDLAHAISEAVQSFGWVAPAPAAPEPLLGKEEVTTDWMRVESLLDEWCRKQPRRDEDGIEWPAPAVAEVALQIACLLKQRGVQPPARFVPNAEGGVVFEFQHQRHLRTIEVEADGSIELCRFEDAKLKHRH
jgi:hypothetical protein